MRKKAIFIVLGIVAIVQIKQAAAVAVAPSLYVTISEPSGPIAFGETPEFATLVWNAPWNMSNPLDVQQLDSPHCVWPNHFNAYTPCPAGIWCGQVRSDVGNPDLFLLHPGYNSMLHVGRNGHIRPIDTNYYTQITFRMYIDSVDPSDPGFQIYWTNGTVADIGGSANRYGGSHLYKTYSGWQIYTVDLSQETTPLNGSLPWSGQLTGLRLDPGLVNMNNKIVMLDWVRLTPRQTRRVSWTADQQTGAVKIKFQSTSGKDELHLYQIVSARTEPFSISALRGSYDVPASLPSGDWYVQLEINGQNSALAGPWQIQSSPTLSFVAPSYTTGEDYAIANLGRAWDMNTSGDIYSYGNTTTPTFGNGVLSSTSSSLPPPYGCQGPWADPYLAMLNDEYWKLPYITSPAIDTSKYRYFTFRLMLEGMPDVSYGWMSRVIWSDLLFQNCGVTNDIPLHAGWNDVSIDLWDITILEPGDACRSTWQASASRRQLRFDPLEVPEATAYHLDHIRLTANDTARRNSVFPVKYLLGKSTGVTVTFYYDTDKNTANGRTRASQYIPPPPATGQYSLFLPFTLKNSGPPDPAGTLTFSWNLTGVPAGAYYISADVNDGYNTTTWYSETPAIITN